MLHNALVLLVRLLHEHGFLLSVAKCLLQPSQRLRFCGVDYDFCAATFQVFRGFRDSLCSDLRKFIPGLPDTVPYGAPRAWSPKLLRRWQQLAGKLAYLLYVSGFCSAFRFWLFSKTGRSRLIGLLSSGPWPLPRPPSHMFASDATPTRIAAVDQLGRPLFAKDIAALPIYFAEMIALWKTARLAPVGAAIFCDNLAVLGATRRSAVRSPLVLALSLIRVQRALTFIYIPSLCNPVDW